MIQAILIDNREPVWIKELKFNNALISHDILDAGDVWAVCDDNRMLVIERKTPSDFLGTLAGDRLFIQAAGLAELRKQGHWPYIMITGDLTPGANGFVMTERGETKMPYQSVQGALLTLQEMGIFVIHCAGDVDFEAAILRLGNRERKETMLVPPLKIGKLLGLQAGFLCGLPGIGPEKVSAILDACGTPAWALVCLTDKNSTLPGIGEGIKNNVRHTLGLLDDQQMGILLNEQGQEEIKILKLGEQ
jgi:ERCC4-type nuclease